MYELTLMPVPHRETVQIITRPHIDRGWCQSASHTALLGHDLVLSYPSMVELNIGLELARCIVKPAMLMSSATSHAPHINPNPFARAHVSS